MVGEDGENLGVLTLGEALKQSNDKGLDLILIVANAKPPVARIMSFDKFRYIKDKELKKQRAAQKAPEQKQIQISAREAENDLQTKMGRLTKFLGEGHRVEILMRLRGREKGMKDWCRGKLEEFIKRIEVPHKIVQNISGDARSFSAKVDPVEVKKETEENKE